MWTNDRRQEKLEVKKLGAHHPKDLKMSQKDTRQNRSFCVSWFQRKEWLTASQAKKSLFCFPCLLFGGDTAWTEQGVVDLKHLSDKIKKHECSTSHIGNGVKLTMLGKVNIACQLDEGHRFAVQRHNELVKKNRHSLSRIVDCIKFCGAHELSLRGSDESSTSLNRGVFLDLVDQFSFLDSQLADHLSNTQVAKYTSKTSQNELLDCMLSVYEKKLGDEISQAPFVAVQADETTDVARVSQCVIVLRYVTECSAVERFLSFSPLVDRTAEGFEKLLREKLQPYKLESKLIAQTYDGAAVMSGAASGLQARLKETFPHAHFVHCYAHQLNLIIQQACSCLTPVRIFFANLTAFATFFAKSPKRTAVLDEVCGIRIPESGQTRWNFKSRTVHTVFEQQNSLKACFEKIQNSQSWDSVSVQQAHGLSTLLEDEDFIFFLEFFHAALMHVDIFYNTLQKRTTDPLNTGQALMNFSRSITGLREQLIKDDCHPNAPRRMQRSGCVSVATQCCSIMIEQSKARFEKARHLMSFELINPELFSQFKASFPQQQLDVACEHFPMICKEKLKGELMVMYSSAEFAVLTSAVTLLKMLIENNLQNTFSETLKLTQIAITTPMTSAESERCFSTLKRIKSFLRSTMGQDRLNALAVLSIERDFIQKSPDFNEMVINLFASQKNRRAELLFK
ncbi:zinc finger MYM-type protein 1-like isoform X2 [Melanotaenia boesemani]|uniref:zinc finger MYM-type protein 1-like isoform X2 n=1 Tax=Melanotaenia boesemani TaxID=1250792 RepID=UPI001C05D9E2|nr:zinc finger MYM-type protein 1-like isoform X2 [Melanotaenia boesemani]